MKKTKIIAPALGLLLLGTAASVTGTVAWFSINSTVAVTGMRVNTKVGNNLLIADDDDDNESSSFGNVLNQTVTGTLEPVSSIDGNSFFYTSSDNVDASGDAKDDAYTAYNPADTAAFNTNYNTSGAVGYVDYKFYLKATNGENANRHLAMTRCNLLYEGSPLTTNDYAWRVAVFAAVATQDTPLSDADTIGTNAANLKSILRRSGAAYYTSESAVSDVDTVSSVSAKIDDAVNIVTLTPAQTVNYKVIVRLWLEGEDTKCTNETFASLTGKYDLDLAFEVRATDGVSALGSTSNALITASNNAATVTLSGGASGNIANGETAKTFAWFKADGTSLSGTTYQYTNNTENPVSVYCEITTTRGNVYRTPSIELAAQE